MREESKKQSLIFVLAVLLFSALLEGQEAEKQTGKKFYNEKEVWTTPFKSQGETGLCAIFRKTFAESPAACRVG